MPDCNIPCVGDVIRIHGIALEQLLKELRRAIDGLDLDMFFPSADFKHTREEKEAFYFKITDEETQAVSIPLAVL